MLAIDRLAIITHVEPGRAQLIECIKEIVGTRVRYGYRRIHVLLRREGWPGEPEAVQMLWRYWKRSAGE